MFDDDIVFEAGLIWDVVEDRAVVVEGDIVENVLEDVADIKAADVFDTALLTMNCPWPALQQVALFEPQQ